jgi:hypothetical protein
MAETPKKKIKLHIEVKDIGTSNKLLALMKLEFVERARMVDCKVVVTDFRIPSNSLGGKTVFFIDTGRGRAPINSRSVPLRKCAEHIAAKLVEMHKFSYATGEFVDPTSKAAPVAAAAAQPAA